MHRDARRAEPCHRTYRLNELRVNAGEEARHPSTAGHPCEDHPIMRRPMAAEKLGDEPCNVVDVVAGVPLVTSSYRHDCLRKNNDHTRALGELFEARQECLASRG